MGAIETFALFYFLPAFVVMMSGKVQMYLHPGESDPEMWVLFTLFPGINMFAAAFCVAITLWLVIYFLITWVPERKT